jgi:hypothetical protein
MFNGHPCTQKLINELTKIKKEPRVVVYACNPNTWEVRQEDHELKASIAYT